ncbi:MAG: rod shape-determining protein MreD [Clostridia bacterium]|nr:rod shape-determining protein MreD [Clostridia bacterium]
MLRLLLVTVAACVIQTTLVRYIRIAGIAPDLLVTFLVAISTYGGPYTGFCAGSLMAMLYDASVGYVLAINLVGYTFIGWAATLLREAIRRPLRKLRHKSYLEMMAACFVLTAAKEAVNVGYLFLIGADQNYVALIRLLACAAYSAVMIIPVAFLLRRFMGWHPIRMKKKQEEDVTEPHR